MNKILLGLLILVIPVLSGCSLPQFGKGGGNASQPTVSLLRSSDGGETFESKSTIDEKTNFSSADIISVASSTQDTRQMLVGTKDSGLFATKDSGDTWKKLNYPPTKIYGLSIDKVDPSRMLATGEWQGRGKIYQSTDAGDNWTEVYTEPANGSVITSLAQNPFNSRVVYAGTSKGVIIRSTDAGDTWQNVNLSPAMQGNVIWSITFDPHQNDRIFMLVGGKGVYVTDGEKIISEPQSTSFLTQGQNTSLSSSGALTLTLDPSRAGVLYIGSAKGVFRSQDAGKTFEALNIIESSKKFPIAAIAINPKDSNEIVYVSALTLYKSKDFGVHWSTHGIASDKNASIVRYDAYNPQTMFIGFKSK